MNKSVLNGLLAGICCCFLHYAHAQQNRIKDYGLKNYVYVSKDLPHKEDKPWKLVCQMPYNCHFQPWIQLKTGEEKQISFNSSNPLVLYLTKTENAVIKPGEKIYEAKNWVSGEGAVYTIPAGVTVEAVKYRETGYNTTFAGSFECNDNDYNILWKKAARTGYICMRDHFYDCPDRERVGFWGDGTPELNQCFYAFDTASHALCKELVLRPLKAGFYPGQQLEFLGEYGLWFYYLQTGDLQSLATMYASTKNFLFNIYKPGKKNQWFDWGKEVKDIAVIENCFLYIDLGTLKKTALRTGHAADTADINAKMDSIKTNFNRSFWKGGYYMSDQVSTPDDRANAMAINAGLAEPGKWDAVCNNVLLKTRYASSFFDRWVFEALTKTGREQDALLRMYDRYKTMIPASISTLWEHYDRWWATKKDAFDDASSLNHGWNPPVIFLSQTIAGISPEEPGWATYHVFPKEAFLRSIKTIVPTIRGNIKMDLKKTATVYSILLTSPAKTRAVVGIPKKSFTTLRSITVNGVVVWNGAYQDKVKNIAWAGEDADYIKFYAGPGTWQFTGNGIIPLASPKPEARSYKETGIRLNNKIWTASASVADSSYLFSGDKIPVDIAAANAIDGDHWTGWRDMRATQYAGQWFQVDMKARQSFNKIVLDNTWALWDSPVQYTVTVSDNGKDWSKPVAQGRGKLGITKIEFPTQQARFIRITQNGTDATYHWSVYEMDVYRKQ
jgi:alpha-L-rhamnosidase